jgi:flagellar basal body rod protein FlgB
MIANNIANANTPKYKRTDISFAETLEELGTRLNRIEEMKNNPPDLLTPGIIASDLSRGKYLAFSYGKSSGDLGTDYARANMQFDYKFYSNGGDIFPLNKDKNLSLNEMISDVKPVIIKTKNSERLDGNNVSVDLEVAEMIKNTSYYNLLVSVVSGDFRIYRTIISAR